MSRTHVRFGRRLVAAMSAGALAVGTLALVASPAQAAPGAVPATTVGSGPARVDDATFTWGVSGYAQKGIFGPWTFKDATGNATVLPGASQTEYTVAPVPVTSMPAQGGSVPANPNAVKFTAGSGVVDPATGAGQLSWAGSYTVNAYPPSFNAPDEIYTDPILTIAADGTGTLTANFSIGAGVDQQGEPFAATDYGRLTLATYGVGSLSNKTPSGFRVTPRYQGVVNGLESQTTTCSTGNGATGWWGSWPAQFVSALNSSAAGQSILPHFQSTGCGGLQDNKPPLPADVTFHPKSPTVTVSNTRVDAAGTTVVTVTGTNFDPALATGTRPPLSGKPAGSYVVFGKFAPTWQPSLGAAAPSANRKGATAASGGLKWAVPGDSLGTVGGANAGAVELSPEGSFTTQLTIDKAALDSTITGDTSAFRYGIYTYPGSGGVAPAYETYTPLRFLPVASTVTLDQTSYIGTVGSDVPIVATVSGPNEPESATGTVRVSLTPDGGIPNEVDSAELVDGAARLELPNHVQAGTGTMTVSYGGDDLYAAAATTATYRLVAEPTRIDLSGPRTVAYRTAATYTAAVSNGATGKIRVTGAGTAQLRTIVNGTATFVLPRTLRAGLRTLRVEYLGDGSVSAAAPVTSTIRIARGATAATASITRKWSAARAGALTVKIRSLKGGPVPVGKVKVRLKKGSKVKNLRVKALSRGKVVLRLPKAQKGAWSVRATYRGSTQHAPVTRTWRVKVPNR